MRNVQHRCTVKTFHTHTNALGFQPTGKEPLSNHMWSLHLRGGMWRPSLLCYWKTLVHIVWLLDPAIFAYWEIFKHFGSFLNSSASSPDTRITQGRAAALCVWVRFWKPLIRAFWRHVWVIDGLPGHTQTSREGSGRGPIRMPSPFPPQTLSRLSCSVLLRHKGNWSRDLVIFKLIFL